MKIKKSETIVLTTDEYNTLNKASELLDKIYHEASDAEIYELANKAAYMIADLFECVEREGG